MEYRDRSLSDIRPLVGGSGGPAVPGLVHAYRIELNGQLYLEAVGVRTLRAWLVPDHIEFRVDGEPDDSVDRTLRFELPLGAEMEFDESGRLLKTRIPRSVSRLAMGVWQAVATRVQWTSSNVGQAVWTAEEADPNGTLTVTYRLGEPREAGTIALERKRDRLIPAENTATQLATEGISRISIDRRSGLIRSLAAEDRTEITLGGQLAGATSSSLSLRPKSLDPGDTKAEIDRLKARWPTETSMLVLNDGRVNLPVDRRAQELQRLVGRRASEVWSEFDRGLRSRRGAMDELLVLKSLLFVQPEQSVAAERRIVAAAADDAAGPILAAALADAGHAPAQAALRKSLSASRSVARKAIAIIWAMGGLAAPDDATLQSLQKIAKTAPNDDERSAALLCLGRLAHALLKSESSRGAKLTAWLVDLVRETTDRDGKRLGILALGNTGSESAFETLLGQLASGDPAIRSAAAFSMRWIPGDRANQTIIDTLRSERSPDVQIQSAAALAFRRNAASRDALLEASHSQIPAVRLACLEALSELRRADAQVLARIRRALDDPDESVRRWAKDVLKP